MKISQSDLILKYYKARPNQDIKHKDVVDWAVAEWRKRTGQVFRDPDRAIRRWHQEGILIKISKGVYRYDPASVKKVSLDYFTESQKQAIFKRDNYRCVVCGKSVKEGAELQIDHIKPRDKGGKSVLENGQVLCSTHNFRKKTYSQTESGKRMFIRLYELAHKSGDQELQNFCKDILDLYGKHDINGHIKWGAND